MAHLLKNFSLDSSTSPPYNQRNTTRKPERRILMALIRCPECGREISDKATACPGCGYPMPPAAPEADDIARRLEEAKQKDAAFLKKATLGMGLAILLMLVMVFVLSKS